MAPAGNVPGGHGPKRVGDAHRAIAQVKVRGRRVHRDVDAYRGSSVQTGCVSADLPDNACSAGGDHLAERDAAARPGEGVGARAYRLVVPRESDGMVPDSEDSQGVRVLVVRDVAN